MSAGNKRRMLSSKSEPSRGADTVVPSTRNAVEMAESMPGSGENEQSAQAYDVSPEMPRTRTSQCPAPLPNAAR